MSLTQRLSPVAARLAHILATKRAVRTLESKWDVRVPELAIYFGGPSVDLYQVEQWLPVFKKLQDELPTVVLMKDSLAALKLAKSSPLPIRLAGSADAIEPLADAWDLKAVFYVNNNLANFSVMRLPRPRHIHLSHGESEKASMTSNQLKAYDYCFVAGQASADRIKAALRLFDDSHLKLVGRPQLDQLIEARPFPRPPGRKTVLYAPTWEGDRPAMAYSSVALAGEKWVADILADPQLRLVYRPHPKTGSRSSAARRADKRIQTLITNATKSDPGAGHLVDTQRDCNPAMVSADVAIFDVSAMAMDFSFLDRPYFVSDTASSAGGGTSSSVLEAARILAATDTAGVLGKIHEALDQGALPGAGEFVSRHFGETRGNPGTQRFRDAVRAAL